MKKSCLASIKENYLSLSSAEKRIADFISQSYDETIGMTTGELASRTNSTPSAVVRCSKALGYSGFRELKMALAMEISKNRDLNYNPYISEDDSPEEILNKIFGANIKTLHDTAASLSREVLSDAVSVLEAAKTVYVYAIGTSAFLASELQYRLTCIGKTALCFTDFPTMKVSTLNIKKGDVAVGISHTGRTVATIDALRLARQSGATTIALTSYAGSEITENADLSLEIVSDEIKYPIEAVSSRVAHLALIDALAVAISSRDSETAKKRARLTHELVNTVRYNEETAGKRRKKKKTK